MSQHPSLREDSVGAKHRNVLKRFERINKLLEQNKWLDRSSVFGLPKVKSMKIKVKKTKEVAAEGVPGEAAATGTAAKPAAVAGAKPAAPAAGKAAAPAKAPAAKAPAPKAPAAKATDKGKK